ncbi:hypothetical protein EDD85DRAFT_793471 [Armillaria nabsnona]|nr:hypothetical protein EDD85DRAFT_793471 [Armillaria nabsnona]
MSSPPRNLRQDLVDCIINHFRDDSSVLRVIRLVGRKWLLCSTFHLFRRGIVLRYDMDCFNFARCKPYLYPLVTSLTITYTDTSSGRRPSLMSNILAPLTQLESLTLNGACTIKSMSSDTFASLGRLSEPSIGCLTTVWLERLGLQKLTISSATQFVAFEPESVKSLLNVEELELQYIHPVIWGNYVLARDVLFSVTDLASTPVGTANELRALIEWYLDCFVVAPVETFNARFICESSRSSLLVPTCDEMWKRWDEIFSESKVLRSLTIELYCMFGRVDDDFCTQAIKDRLPRLSDGGKLTVNIPVV